MFFFKVWSQSFGMFCYAILWSDFLRKERISWRTKSMLEAGTAGIEIFRNGHLSAAMHECDIKLILTNIFFSSSYYNSHPKLLQTKVLYNLCTFWDGKLPYSPLNWASQQLQFANLSLTSQAALTFPLEDVCPNHIK